MYKNIDKGKLNFLTPVLQKDKLFVKIIDFQAFYPFYHAFSQSFYQ